MMARANLNVDPRITEEFLAAQENRTIRMIKVQIAGENLIPHGVANKVGNAESDFNKLLKMTLMDTQATFVFFCLTDSDTDPLSWLFLTWIPEGCSVRDKMLYSSSRDDLKRTIGYGYFNSEYGANTKDDITWELFQKSLHKDFSTDILSETERLVLEEKALTRDESNTSKSSAMNVLPFELAPEVVEQIGEFKNNNCNWVDVTLDGEVVKLVFSRTVKEFDSYKALVSKESACFIMVRLTKLSGATGTYFVFSCPEDVPIRTKMMMSSSKASVIASAEQQGLKFDKTLEIRDPNDIDDVLRAEMEESIFTSSLASSSSASANLSHNKPTKPGRGRTKVAKFQGDV